MRGKTKKRMMSRTTGKESSLFDFVEQKEKLFCPFCKERFDVEKSQGGLILLGCGHAVIREISVAMEEDHNWRLKFGFPKISGGWHMPPDVDVYPGPGEMAVRVRMMPGIVEEVRKVMGTEWQPKVME